MNSEAPGRLPLANHSDGRGAAVIGVGTEPRLWAVCRSLVFPVGYPAGSHRDLWARTPPPGLPSAPARNRDGLRPRLGASCAVRKEPPRALLSGRAHRRPGLPDPGAGCPAFQRRHSSLCGRAPSGAFPRPVWQGPRSGAAVSPPLPRGSTVRRFRAGWGVRVRYAHPHRTGGRA